VVSKDDDDDDGERERERLKNATSLEVVIENH
jgi:hypothetical protein